MDLGSDSQGQPGSNGNETTSRAHLDQPGWEENTTKYAAESDDTVEMRRRIHAIWKLDVSSQEKARLMHGIMTEGYYSAVKSRSPPPTPQGHDAPCTPESSRKQRALGNLSSSSESDTGISGSPYYLSQEDLERTYFCRPVNDNQPADDPFTDSLEEAASGEVVELGCMHYKRNVKIQCFTCKKWYPCRFCHNESESHTLDRKKTENMLCMLCYSPQPAGQWCNSCGAQSAFYYCSICKLWDDDAEKSIYHCGDCGICRLGQGLGKDFFHCQTCSACIPIAIQNTHRCIERSTKCDCPICGEFMFSSPDTVIFMRCGHSIHQKCFSEHSRSSYRCPICSKSVTNMEANFRNLDRTIISQPMPPELKDTNALIYCNDCHAKSVVPYHWLGLKCEICESYNTIQRQLLNGSYNPAQPTEGRQNSVSGGESLGVPIHGTSNDHRTGARNSVIETPGHHFHETPTDSGGSQARSLPHTSFLHSSGAAPRSPVVTNYFALSRQEDVDSSTSQSRGPMRLTRGSFSGFNFWSGVNIKERLGLFGSSDAETEPGSDGSSDNQETEDEDDEDEDESPDTIDIFGHR
ncbi:RING finger protein [Trichophyton mentagrophytes]|nr:RING finger protein [Trichophyton mentagrophytes]